MNIYDFKAITNKGEEISLSQYRGKILLIVNTATGCGFTPQYKGLQDMYERLNERGFEILDFPCNQFAFQAPGDDAKIDQFCTVKYKTTFPRFKKIKVNGGGADPIYNYLKEATDGKRIKWNFTKFLIDREGNIKGRFAPSETPESIESKVEELL